MTQTYKIEIETKGSDYNETKKFSIIVEMSASEFLKLSQGILDLIDQAERERVIVV